MKKIFVVIMILVLVMVEGCIKEKTNKNEIKLESEKAQVQNNELLSEAININYWNTSNSGISLYDKDILLSGEEIGLRNIIDTYIPGATITVFDKEKTTYRENDIKQVKTEYYVIDSEESFEEFLNKSGYGNERSEIKNVVSAIKDEILGKNQMATIAVLTFIDREIGIENESIKKEIVDILKLKDSKSVRIKYGDGYKKTVSIGGAGLQLRTYDISGNTQYTKKELREALLDNIKSNFNLDKIKELSEKDKKIMMCIKNDLPYIVTNTGTNVFPSNPTPEMLKEYVDNFQNPKNITTIEAKYLKYPIPLEIGETEYSKVYYDATEREKQITEWEKLKRSKKIKLRNNEITGGNYDDIIKVIEEEEAKCKDLDNNQNRYPNQSELQ